MDDPVVSGAQRRSPLIWRQQAMKRICAVAANFDRAPPDVGHGAAVAGQTTSGSAMPSSDGWGDICAEVRGRRVADAVEAGELVPEAAATPPTAEANDRNGHKISGGMARLRRTRPGS